MKNVDVVRALCVLVIAIGFIFSSSAAAQQGEPKRAAARPIDPPDVYALTMFVRKELELIRLEMGKPAGRPSALKVKNAAPREVLFQALTLFRKTKRLCFEQLREHIEMPEVHRGKIRPAQVHAVVDKVLTRLQNLKAGLGIKEKSEKTPRDASKTPTDVFRSIGEANRQLNVLIEKPFSPSDVFQQVTLGVGYAARLLARFPGATRIPAAPKFERRKRPDDVFRRLVSCFERCRAIAESAGLPLLELEAKRTEGLSPSDVYDVASLVVSELAYLHAQLKDSPPPREVFQPGTKFPAHVYQRAGLLESQLIQLEEVVGKNPDWLTQAQGTAVGDK
ncbi:MAG: hypothetical protein V3T86_03900 [Planctomycetota bacterium]